MPRKTRGKTDATIVQAARELRGESTRAEEILWQALRGRRLNGLKFRRQHPYGQFVLDMFCVEYQLAIEVDGAVHQTPGQPEYDQARTAFLAEHGIRVLRFPNRTVEYHLEEVLKQIIAATSTPSPDDVHPSEVGVGHTDIPSTPSPDGALPSGEGAGG
jgi:very-short-patch-repair endonuclease